MKKNVISVLLIILLIQFIKVTPIYAEDFENIIQFELISDSDDLKSILDCNSVIANIVNQQITKANNAKNYGRDYPLLDSNELNFSTNPDIYCIRSRDIYNTDIYNASINDIKEKAKFEFWYVQYLKEDVMYMFKLYNHQPVMESSSGYFKISDSWYLDDFRVEFLGNIEFSSDYRLYPKNVIENMNRLLPETDRKSKIKLIKARLNIYNNDCYIVCVDNNAKYVYCETYRLLSHFHSDEDYTDDATEEDKENINHLRKMLYNNFYSDSHEIKKLYSYNMIVFITSYVYSKIDNIHEYD